MNTSTSSLLNLSASREQSAAADSKRGGGAQSTTASALFGPVLQQQTDARSSSGKSTSAERPAAADSGQNTRDKQAEATTGPQATGQNGAAEKSGQAVLPEDSSSGPETAKAEASTAETEAVAATAGPTSPDLLALNQPLQQQPQAGKNLPVTGKFLPVADNATLKTHMQNQLPAQTGTDLATEADFGSAEAGQRVLALPGSSDLLQHRGSMQMAAFDSNDAAGARTLNTDFNALLTRTGIFTQGAELAGVMDLQADAAEAADAPDSLLPASATTTLVAADKAAALRQAAPVTTSFQIDAQPGSPAWNNQVGDKIRWMSKADISSAELKLNPAELGTIEVKIYTEDQQTRVSFITSNAATREMIEATLPKLRELLQLSGLQLEQSDISHRNDSEKPAEQESTIGHNLALDDADTLSAQIVVREQQRLGQVDQYV